MIRGITFDKQLMSSADHAHEVNYYFGGDMGVTKGCTIAENVDGDLVVAAGYFLIKGRLVNVIGSEIVAVPSVASGTLYSILVFEIDLTKVNTTSVFNQGAFKIVSNSSAYPTLTQQDLDDGGTLYQFEFARFENSISGIANLTDTRVLLDLTKYATKVYVDAAILGTTDLIYEHEVTGSAVTSIDITGLDINAHKSYRIEVELANATASNSQVSMYVNGDNTPTNYYSQYVFASGLDTTLTARTNGAQAVYLDASYKCSGVLHLQTVLGQPMCTSTLVDNINTTTSANIRMFNLAWAKKSVVTNITRLTFVASVASSIAVGSKIRIYKG